jgi:hypothetical protein
VRAPVLFPREIPVVVPIERLDRASLTAIAYALSISWDVTALHVETGGADSEGIRERWRMCRDGVRLDIVDSEVDLATYLAERDERDLVVVMPTIVPRPRWLYPFVNWSALRRARDVRRDGAAVVTVPVRV